MNKTSEITSYYNYLFGNNISMRSLLTILLLLPFLSGCSKDEDIPDSIPEVVTANITSIDQLSASCGGNIISQGSTDIIEKGVCWSTSPDPTINDNSTTEGSGEGDFTSNITGLNPNTDYYVRAYATNNIGTGYGDVKSFTTNGIVIPNDTLAFYVIEGVRPYYQYYCLCNYTVDSIREIKSKLVDYSDIISYDTTSFRFEINAKCSANVLNLLLHTSYHVPLVAISKGEVLFFVYLSNDLSSSSEGYYYLRPYFTSFTNPTNGWLQFRIDYLPEENDKRKDPVMLEILDRHNKLK